MTADEIPAKAYAALTGAEKPLPTTEVRAKMPDPPTIRTVRTALLRLAERGAVLRDAPLSEDVARRTPRWRLPSLELPLASRRPNEPPR